MAQGQTTRNNLSLRDTSDVPGAMREIKRWADRLPIGAAGFHVARSAGQVIASGITANVVFATIIANKERWQTTTSSYTVPPGLSGVYILSGAAYWAANLANISVGISINNAIGVGLGASPAIVKDRSAISGVYLLKERDVITLSVTNGSAGNITITDYAGDSTNPMLPLLSAWRISLL